MTKPPSTARPAVAALKKAATGRVFLLATFALILVLSMGAGLFSYRNLLATKEANQWQKHSYLAILELQKLLGSVTDAETGQRGFVITGDRQYLEPYDLAMVTVEGHLKTLRILASDNANQHLRLNAIESIIRAKLAQMDKSIKLRSSEGFQSARDLMMTGVGRKSMNELRAQINLAVHEEERLLGRRNLVEAKYFDRNFYLLLLATSLGIVILLTLYLLLWREAARRVRTEQQLIAHRDLLEMQNEELRKERDQRQVVEALLGKYSDLYDFAPVGYFTLARTGIMRAVNVTGARLLGSEPSALVGQNLDLFLSDGARTVFHDFLDRVFATAVKEASELVFQKEGEAPIFVQIEAVAAGSGEDCRAVLVDVSERKRAEEEKFRLEDQLHQAQKMESVGRLAGGVAHDFNNMLSVIIGQANLALMDLEPTQPLHVNIEEIRKAAERSANLTRQLLAFARKQTIAPKVLNLNEAVAGMLTILKRIIGENIDLKWLPGEDLWPVNIDPSQIDQILVNLCANSRDSIADFGAITIETRNAAIDESYCAHNTGFVPGEYVQLAVTDSGCGMDKQLLAHVFEPFFTTKGVGKGTGLGLATVFGAVKQNRGFINVYSEPGMGTSITIYLPRHFEEGELAAKQAAAPQPEYGQETILLVEDEPAVLNMAAMILTRQGYTVLAASSPGEAILLARKHGREISLLMTDVIMPEMNGWDLAQNLLSINPQLKCLFMSGYASDVIAQHGVIEEGVNFIQKPFSMADLAAKVRKVLDSP